MIIYKPFLCPKCLDFIVTMEFDGEKYKGFCPICRKEIIEKAYGDEEKIEEEYGR